MVQLVAKILGCCCLVCACSPSPSVTLERANALMRAQAPAGTAIDIEPGSEKLFNADPVDNFVCGRATLRRPGQAGPLVQRFIITTNKAADAGGAEFESLGAWGRDRHFADHWQEFCAGHVLPALTTPTGAAALATNFDLAAMQVTPDQLADPWKTIAALRALALRRGPSESGADYKARLERIGAGTLYDQVQMNKPIAFEQTDATMQLIQYEIGKVSYMTSSIGSMVVLERRALAASADDRFFGVPLDAFQRQLRSEHQADFTFDEMAILGLTEASGYRITAEVKDPWRPFNWYKGKIAVVYVGYIVPRYREMELGYPPKPPLGSKPLSLVRVMGFNLKGVWLINTDTGQVLTREFKFNKDLPGMRSTR